jgi:uncharacterized protein (TIGR00725 family)
MQRTTPIVAVFGASHAAPGDGHYEQGLACGRLLAEAGFDVATGGYGGLMEAVSEGARLAGGHVIGVTAPGVFPNREGANRHVVEERAAPSLTERIHSITAMASATITLHGSLGTATELLVAWNLAFVARFSGETPAPVVVVGAPWHGIVADLAKTLETDGSLVTCVDTVEAAVAEVRRKVEVS